MGNVGHHKELPSLKILTYKRTHTGDPDINGIFGVHNCMGHVREYDFDAVIGVGGIGAEPRSYGIDRRINWVGINAKKGELALGHPSVVTFEHFVLFEDEGPLLDSLAPNLAKRMYNVGARILLSGYTEIEKDEASSIIKWVIKKYRHSGMPHKTHRPQGNDGCSRRGCGTG